MREADIYAGQRKKMVENQIIRRGVQDMRVLEAMSTVPRHEFVEPDLRDSAYGDHPLSIGLNQTISQPYIVALMIELLGLKGGEKVLEIGTGCGYQAAVLAQVCGELYTIEIIESLATGARKRLQRLGYDNVQVLCGDGYHGFKQEAPYDGIIVATAPSKIPRPLLGQIKVGARMVIPVGVDNQIIKVVEKTNHGTRESTSIAVRFVPMTGEAEK